jgi:adenylate cyclase
VNTAARLESATKDLGADIVLSESTFAAVRDKFALNDLGEIHVKGKEHPLHVYSVKGGATK